MIGLGNIKRHLRPVARQAECCIPNDKMLARLQLKLRRAIPLNEYRIACRGNLLNVQRFAVPKNLNVLPGNAVIPRC